MSGRPLHFVTVVWGDLFIDHYLSAALPTCLASGNFGASLSRPDDRYFIYTTPHDADVIQQSAGYRRLSSLIKTEIRTFDPERTKREHERLSCYDGNAIANTYYGATIPESVSAGAALVMLTPDQMWSNNSFLRLRQLMDSGKKVISQNTLCVIPETFIPALRQFYDRSTDSIPISSRDLIRLAIPSMHSYTRTNDVEGPFYANFSPSGFYWNVEGEGLIYYMTGGDAKLIVHPNANTPWPIATGFELLDHVQSLGFREEEWHWEQDTESFLYLALDFHKYWDFDYKIDPRNLDRSSISLSKAAWWLRWQQSPLKRSLCKRPLRFNHAEKSAKWHQVEQRAQQFMDSIFEIIEFMDRMPAFADDLHNQFMRMNEAVKEQRELQEMLGKIYAALPQDGEASRLHSTLATRNAVLGDVKQALSHIKFIMREDPNKAITLANQAAEILQFTDRTETAVEFLKGCEALIQNIVREALPFIQRPS